MKRFTYELIFVNKIFDTVTLYFKNYNEISSFVDSDLFINNVLFVVSCYNYKTHSFVYNIRRSDI